MVKRIFVEKKQGLDIEGREYKVDFTERLQLKGVENVRVIVRYDIEGIDDEQYNRARNTIFSEPQVDNCYD